MNVVNFVFIEVSRRGGTPNITGMVYQLYSQNREMTQVNRQRSNSFRAVVSGCQTTNGWLALRE